MALPISKDTIIIHDLRLNSTVGPDRWGKTRPQPIVVSIHVEASLIQAGASDDVADSVHYGNLAKDVVKATENVEFHNLFELAESIAQLALKMDDRVLVVNVQADAKNQFLQAESLGVEMRRTRTAADEYQLALIRDLRTSIIIGVNPPEREAKQTVLLNLKFHNFDWTKLAETQGWQKIHAELLKTIERTEYLTLEAFVREVARAACQIESVDAVTIRAQKPSALTTAHSSGVEISRNRVFFDLPSR
ncbi:tetrahydrobiopterin biosynthesis enzymes-like protein [Mycena alexandri]|uniref:dihydroneopterin aldolase n=1 Tax=Mycena alexandri TaxID=1745969 RepID=A0AAD6THJ0_9AGAR|nr:tetrahydrobiopterin biosynthesis enzymes-like protein [Mycena alexandri]